MRSTRNIGDAEKWQGLLSSLTDDELARYGEIAADQRRQEWRHAWVQVLLVAASAACFVWAVFDLTARGVAWRGVAALALSTALAYWPYRQAVVRALWRRHCRAVEKEKARRHGGQADPAGGAEGTEFRHLEGPDDRM